LKIAIVVLGSILIVDDAIVGVEVSLFPLMIARIIKLRHISYSHFGTSNFFLVLIQIHGSLLDKLVGTSDNVGVGRVLKASILVMDQAIMGIQFAHPLGFLFHLGLAHFIVISSLFVCRGLFRG